MPAWDNVQLPSAPAAPSYAAPLVDLTDKIGNLGKDYFAGTQQARTLAQQRAFQGGLPVDPQTGQIDVRSAMNTMARLGGVEAVSPFLTLEIQRQLGQQSQQNILGASGGQPQNTGPVASHGVGRTQAPDQAQTETPTVPPAQPQERPEPDTVSNIAKSVFPDDPKRAANFETSLTARLNVDPYTKVDPNDPIVKGYISAAKGGTMPTGGAAGGPSPRPATVAQRFDAATPPAQSTANQAPIPAGQPGFWSLDNAARYERKAQMIRAGAASGAFFPNAGPAMQNADQAAKEAQDTAKQIRDVVAPTTEEKNLTRGTSQSVAVQEANIKRGTAAYNGIKGAGDQWERDIKPLNDLAQGILNDPRMYSGVGADRVLDWNKVRAATGGDPKAAMLQEALTKVTAATTLGIINQTRDQMSEAGSNAGRIFSQQVDLVSKASPQLTTSLGGNRFLMNVQAKMGELTSQVKQMANNYISDPRHPYLDANFDRMLSKYLTDNPVFNKQELAHPEVLAAPTMPAFPATPQGIAQQNIWARSMGIKQGEPVKTQTGKYRVFVYVSPTKAGPGPQPQAAGP